MSAQTGTASIPPPAPGTSLLDRARVAMQRLTRDPNPVWMRELRQSARLQRTPVILMATTVAVALLICSVGGVASVTAEPAPGKNTLRLKYGGLKNSPSDVASAPWL